MPLRRCEKGPGGSKSEKTGVEDSIYRMGSDWAFWHELHCLEEFFQWLAHCDHYGLFQCEEVPMSFFAVLSC